MRFAAPNGDFLTPSILGVSESEFNDRDLRYSKEMFRFMGADEAHGETNRELMQEWLAKWTPYSVAAAKGLEPRWSEPEAKPVSFERSYERVQARFEGILSDLELRMPQEVTA